MKKLATITAVAVLVVVTMTGPSLAGSRHHHDHGGHHHHHHHRRHVVHGPVIFWSTPVYVPPTTYVVPVGGHWYYCPSAQAYYPYVTNCLEAWVAVPVR
jgi:hypothetical protein